MTLSRRFLLALLAAALLVPTAAPMLPTSPVLAADESCEDSLSLGDDGNGVNYALLCGGSGGSTTPPTSSGGGPYCAAGWGYWTNPRYADPSTGRAVTYAGDTAVSSGGSVSDSPALRAFFDQAWARAGRAISGSRSNPEAFYWKGATVDIAAMILQIEPATAGGAWRFRRMSTNRARIWDASREVDDVVTGSLKNIPYPGADPRYGETLAVMTPSYATRFRVTSFPRSLLTDSATEPEILTRIAGSFGSLVGGGPMTMNYIVDTYLTPFDGWDARQLPAGALKSAYAAAAIQIPNGTGRVRGAFELRAETGNTNRAITLDEVAALPGDTNISVYAYTPNHRPVQAGLDKDELYDKLVSVVTRNLAKQPGQKTVDEYGLGTSYDASRYYAFPVFHAPSRVASPGVCSNDEFSIPRVAVTVQHLIKPWDTSSADYNGCRTVAVHDLASFERNITAVGDLRGGACWLNWRVIRIPEPKFNWDEDLNGLLPAVAYLPTVSGAVGDRITLRAHRDSRGTISYRDGVFEQAIPWSEDKQSTVTSTYGVPRQSTYFNFTQVGVSAEVGVPGAGGQVLARVTRTSAAGREYDLTLTFARTALAQYQTAACRNLSRDALRTYCGIRYDATRKEWYYEVRLRTWYGGVYYAPGSSLSAPRLRGLFNVKHTAGLPSTLTSAAPDRIRAYRWPAVSGVFQDTAMAFAGRSGPRFVASGGAWSTMRSLAATIPAYTASSGSVYPIADVSGGIDSCTSGFADGSRCYVNVYVRSRQPILGE
jgi:hypothetical protein